MSYENPFLTDFAPVFFGVLKEKNINPAKLELIIIDEESDGYHMFESADVGDVILQLCDDINALTIYTERRAYFAKFAEWVYEENGLLAVILEKKELLRQEMMCTGNDAAVILDFEWEGTCSMCGRQKCGYIPIHKKPWKIGENLDILVPFGYNTVIVKRKQMTRKRFVRDRFEEGFYGNE